MDNHLDPLVKKPMIMYLYESESQKHYDPKRESNTLDLIEIDLIYLEADKYMN
jgi:hypothetical protein